VKEKIFIHDSRFTNIIPVSRLPIADSLLTIHQ